MITRQRDPSKTPRSGAAATLFSLRTPSKTLPEYRYAAPSFFHQQANVFAFALLRLWVPNYPSEVDDSIPNYQLDNKTRSLKSEPPSGIAVLYHQYPFRVIQDEFLKGTPVHLGALTLLNLLMAGDFGQESLVVVEQPETDVVFFSQTFCDFWTDHFKDSEAIQLSNAQFSVEQKINAFTLFSKHHQWWDAVFSETSARGVTPRALLLREFVETALRILLTPKPLLQHIAHAILGDHPPAQNFINYFFAKITRFKDTFQSMLTVKEHTDWQTFIKNEGFLVIKQYEQHLAKFRLMDRLINQQISFNLSEELLKMAIPLESHSLYECQMVHQIQTYSLSTRIEFFRYLIQEVKINPAMHSNANHPLWMVLARAVSGLHNSMLANQLKLELSETDTVFFVSLIMKSIQYRQNELACFFMLQKQSLVHETVKCIFLSQDNQWLNHSLLYIAQQNQNQLMCDFLHRRSAILLYFEHPSYQPPSVVILKPKPMRPRGISVFISGKPDPTDVISNLDNDLGDSKRSGATNDCT